MAANRIRETAGMACEKCVIAFIRTLGQGKWSGVFEINGLQNPRPPLGKLGA